MALEIKSSENKIQSISLTAIVSILVAVTLFFAGIAPVSSASNSQTGNGAPSGPHYNLNIIGIAKGGSQSKSNDGHTIFVPLYGNCKIMLQEGSFQVIQDNCLQGNAEFQLPNPNDTTTGYLAYSVWARAVTPGAATMAACFNDTTTNTQYCNVGSLVVSLNKVNPPKFTDVSKQLLEVCVSGQEQALFSNNLYNYFWNYTNNGLHLAQLRFYPIETTVAGGTC